MTSLAQSNVETIPKPPFQQQHWTPPITALPPIVIDAVTKLFDDGLPDPRGCDYREVEFAEAKNWTYKIHGWVLPGQGTQQYFIAWNGVIYPVVSVGPLVDLSKEINSIRLDQFRFRGNDCGWPMSDRLSADIKCGLPLHIAFLLRLGHGDWAEQLWKAGNAGRNETNTPDPYSEMAGVWLDRWYNRAVQAFLNHDDSLALEICNQVASAIVQVKATAAKRGITDPWPISATGNRLWQLPVLQADLEYRVNEKPFVPVVKSGLPAQESERITALIHDLEQAHVTQDTNPGDVDITRDPTVQALIKEGPQAVEPLLQCLIEDNRLTRAKYTKNMSIDGPIIPVYEAAYKALFHILNVSFPLFEHNLPYPLINESRNMSPQDRKVLAAKLRTVWDEEQRAH